MILQMRNDRTILLSRDACVDYSDGVKFEYANEVIDIIDVNQKEFLKVGVWAIVYGHNDSLPVLKFCSNIHGVLTATLRKDYSDITGLIDFMLLNLDGENARTFVLTTYSEKLWEQVHLKKDGPSL